jgi:cell division protein FtsW (lipid II flippase)
VFRTRSVGNFDFIVVLLSVGLIGLGIDALRALSSSVQGISPDRRQLAWVAVGLLLAVCLRRIPDRWFGWAGGCCWLLSVILLGIVLTQPPVNGARSWLRWGLVGFQPSELAKLGICWAGAVWLARRGNFVTWLDLFVLGVLVAVPSVLTVVQPDLGSALLLGPIGFSLLVARGCSGRLLLFLCGLAFLAALAAWPLLSTEQRARLVAFLDQDDLDSRPKDEGYQLYQSKRIIALSGWLGRSGVLDEPLPMAHNDFIFSVVVWRRGCLGAAVVALGFLGLVWRLLHRALVAPRLSDRLFCTAVATWIGVQGAINVSMSVGLAPITGVTLPLVSYGGSSMVVTLAALALVLRRTSYENT